MTLDRCRKKQATAEATADFSTAAAKCAASGRNDGLWVVGKKVTAKATTDFLGSA
jgi:hypothetical protein